MITYKTFMEKLFDGQFVRKSEQDEAMEVLQSLGKFVDSRKVREDRMALRNEIFVLVKRPMTAKGTGYLIAQVVDDSGGSGIDNEVDAKIRKVEQGIIKNELTNTYYQKRFTNIENTMDRFEDLEKEIKIEYEEDDNTLKKNKYLKISLILLLILFVMLIAGDRLGFIDLYIDEIIRSFF